MFSDRIVSLLLGRFRGKHVAVSPRLSSGSVLANLLRKGLGPYLRGLIAKPWLGQTRGTLFLGRGCTILSGRHLRLGKNVYIGSYSYLDCLCVDGVEFGDNVTLREFCWLQLTSHYDNPGSGISIGNNVYIGPRMILGAGAPIVIGERCQFGANVSLVAENHQYAGDRDISEQGVVRKGITIGRDVWVGNSVTILDGVTIGDGVVIGAGSVVTKSVPAKTVVAGVPAAIIKTR